MLQNIVYLICLFHIFIGPMLSFPYIYHWIDKSFFVRYLYINYAWILLLPTIINLWETNKLIFSAEMLNDANITISVIQHINWYGRWLDGTWFLLDYFYVFIESPVLRTVFLNSISVWADLWGNWGQWGLLSLTGFFHPKCLFLGVDIQVTVSLLESMAPSH